MPTIILGILIPFLGTALGSFMVFFMHDKLNQKIEKALLGFASGVMIAASVWSLLIPAIDQSGYLGKLSWIPASVGLFVGFLFLLILDIIIPHLHNNSKKPEGLPSKLKKSTMMIFAVTLHNIPEGMAVGVAFAGAFFGNSTLTMVGAMVLSIGIAIQNFPEGAIISMPLKAEGLSKPKSFLYGVLSGVVEPIFAIFTFLITSFIVSVLPYLLSFAAGAMIFVVIEELIPETKSGFHTNLSTIGFALGFVLMMILDVALG